MKREKRSLIYRSLNRKIVLFSVTASRLCDGGWFINTGAPLRSPLPTVCRPFRAVEQGSVVGGRKT